MFKMLRKVVGSGLLLSGLLLTPSAFHAQEPTVINGALAVRFEQSPGFYHYVAFCRTPKEFTPGITAGKLPPDQTEYGLCWYVNGSKTANGDSGADGKLVISEHHVRFIPRDAQAAALYIDLPRSQVELKRQSGQPNGTVEGKGQVLNFRFTKLCANCAAGTPPPPGLDPAHVDQEFNLLQESLRNFFPVWRQIYQMSGAKGSEQASPNSVASSAPPAKVHGAPAAKPAPAPQEQSVSAAPSPQAEPEAPVADNPPAAAPSKAAAVAAAKPARTTTGVKSALGGPETPYSIPNSSVAAAVKPMPAGPMIVPRLKPVKIGSGAADGLLVKKIPPDYPLEAKLVRLEGTVVLHAIIDRSGGVAQVNAVSGPPLLESAAVDAVKQWQYRPYSMNGQPVDVETTVEVVFALDGSHPATRAQSARK